MGFYLLQLQGSFSIFYLLEYTSPVWITFSCGFFFFFPSSILEEGEVHTEVGELPEAASDVFGFLLAPLKRLC